MKNQFKNTLKIIILGLILAGGITYLHAWTAPTCSPPSCNASAPINQSINLQTKTGPLRLHNYLAIDGVDATTSLPLVESLTVMAGGIGIGTTLMPSNLSIDAVVTSSTPGNIGANSYCDAGGLNCTPIVPLAVKRTVNQSSLPYQTGLGYTISADLTPSGNNPNYASPADASASSAIVGHYHAASGGYQAANTGAGVVGIFDGFSTYAGNTYGVEGINSDSGNKAIGVYGKSTNGPGVSGYSVNDKGLYGASDCATNATDTRCTDPTAGIAGVFGYGNGTFGVLARSVGSTALFADATYQSGHYAIQAQSIGNSTIVATDKNTVGWGLWAGGTGNGTTGGAILASGNVTVQGNISLTGSVINNSDQRLKKNVTPISDALQSIGLLNPVTFKWIDPLKHGNETGTMYGFIAQDVEKIFPSWVQEVGGYKNLNYNNFIALSVEAIKELNAKNTALEQKNADLQNQLDTLSKRVSAIESTLVK